MNTNNKEYTLFMFTSQYPYGTGETFIESELAVLSQGFSKIYIFPLTKTSLARSIPLNAEVVNWSNNFKYNGLNALFNHLIIFTKIFLFEFYHSSSKTNFIKRLLNLKSILLQNIVRAEYINKFIEFKNPNALFYTYWFEDWATVLGILKEKKQIPYFHSRVHGFDLFDERRKEGFIPFRNFQIRSVENVFSVSKYGANYLAKKFPSLSSKVKLSYLGVFDNGTNPFNNESKFTIVSCSNLISIKRIHLIIEILKRTTINLNWIHFGDGPLKLELSQQVKRLPSNISVNFKGQAANDEIINFYKSNTVHLFITTSETEGLPVSIQEAISFGIPVIATNVGGISEIVNEQTGFLIEENFNIDEIAQLIMKFKASPKNSGNFRDNVREYWKKHFNADVNYQSFCKQLKGG